MFNYDVRYIKYALESSNNNGLKITDRKIEEIKSNPQLETARKRLAECLEFYGRLEISPVSFTLFNRFFEDGDRAAYEKEYFRRRGHLKTWALHLLLDKENKEYKQRLEDTIWAICDEYTWCLPAHYYLNVQDLDLFGCETTGALAEVIFLLGDIIHPRVAKRAKDEIMRRGIDCFCAHTDKDFLWSDPDNRNGNWTPVCSGSLGIAAMCMLDDNDKLADIIYRVNKIMELYFAAYPDDGACPEGLGYWGYGFGFFASYADTLYNRTNGKINLFKFEKVRLFASFPAKMLFYGSRCVGFSDGGSFGGMSLSLTSLLKRHYPDLYIPSTTKLGCDIEIEGCHRFTTNLRTLTWPSDGVEKEEAGAKTYILDKVQWYVASSPDKVGFCCKAGFNDEHHNHNDVGHFEIFKAGEEFFADLGAGTYSGPYFGSERYTFIHAGSHGHSVPIINGKYQKFGKQFAAKDVSFSDEGMTADISGAYAIDELKKLNRTFKFDKEKSIIYIKDEYELSGDNIPVTERFVSWLKPEIADGKVTLTAGNGTSMSLYFDTSVFDAGFEAIDSGKGTVYVTDLKVKEPKANMTVEFEIK